MNSKNIRNIEQLKEEASRGTQLDFLFFWGHRPKQPGVADRSCLSNWFPAEFEFEGETYPTTEHFMMAEKAELFGDDIIREAILRAETPSEAKKLGRQVSNFDEKVWSEACFETVVLGNLQKFSQNPELSEFLLQTEDQILVEASPLDAIWGIGLGINDRFIENPALWPGRNLLGFALMEVRQHLREG